MFYLLLLIVILLVSLIVYNFTKNIYTPNSVALQQHNVSLVSRDPFLNPRLIDFTDFFEYNKTDFEYLSKFYKYYYNYTSDTDELKITTLTNDLSNFARDLYQTYCVNRKLEKTKITAQYIYDEWKNAIKDVTKTIEMSCWSAIFALESGHDVNSDFENLPLGFFALPYFILKHNYPGLPKNVLQLPTHILPKSKGWFLPCKNVDDYFAIQQLGYEFDSIIEDKTIRWYHVALANFNLPNPKYKPFKGVFTLNDMPELYHYNPYTNEYVLYSNNWFSFLPGHKIIKNNREVLQNSEGGIIESANTTSVVMNGKFKVVLPNDFRTTTVFYNGKQDYKSEIAYGRSIVIYYKELLLNAYRRIQFSNMSKDSNITIQNNNTLIITSSNEKAITLVDSSLEDCISTHEQNYIDNRKITISTHGNKIVSERILFYNCGEAAENIVTL